MNGRTATMGGTGGCWFLLVGFGWFWCWFGFDFGLAWFWFLVALVLGSCWFWFVLVGLVCLS